MCQRKDERCTPSCIRVVIVDDHPGIRRALATVLHAFDDLELVGEADIGEKALPLCARSQPDVALIDLVMPGMSGIQVIQRVHERWPQIRIIAMTTFQEPGLARQAVRAGAACCLLKNVSAQELAHAIHVTHANAILAPFTLKSPPRNQE
jgi:DNA-binding NarL/FixJ family response regulator